MRTPSRRAVVTAMIVGAALFMRTSPSRAAEFTFRLLASDPLSGADASISPDGTMFATSSRRGGTQNIWVYDIAAAHWRQLTSGVGDDSEPSWSADGHAIAFTSSRGGARAIWTVRVNDGALARLTFEATDVDYPSWSPDGRSIVYTSGPWKARRFRTVSSAGGSARDVSSQPGHLGACRYYPDGRSLICHTYENNRGNVVRLSLNGVVLDHLTNGSALDYKPSISPDGREVAFSRVTDGASVIWLSPANSARPERASTALTEQPGENRWPTYAKSGQQLFFHRVLNSGTSLMVYHRGTGRLETLSVGDGKPGQASFDSTARHVAYCSEVGGRNVVRILDRSAGTFRTLDLGGREACFPRYSPDDRTLALTIKDGESWRIATVDPDGSNLHMFTRHTDLHGVNGPLDWSPDGTRLLFKADTAPYESAIFTLDTRSAALERITTAPDFFEAPSWAPDGQSIVYMAAHSGEWLWGLYRHTLRNHQVVALAANDSTEKNYPRLLPDGSAIWMQANSCDATEFVVERNASGQEHSLTRMPGGHWPSHSRDSQQILFTASVRDVQFWLADRIATPASAVSKIAFEQR